MTPKKENEKLGDKTTFDSSPNDPTTFPSSQVPIDLTRRSYLTQKLPTEDITHTENIVGLGAAAILNLSETSNQTLKRSIDETEQDVREKAVSSPWKILILSNIGSVKVFGLYLITIPTIISMALSIFFCCYWYFDHSKKHENFEGDVSWKVLGFIVIMPLSTIVKIAFDRREFALKSITKFKSFAFQIYLAHSIWDWGKPPSKGRAATNCDWVRHSDAVLEQLIGIGDELTRFLTLPNYTKTRHRLMQSGREEAARTVEVAYHLFDSLYAQRIMKLTLLMQALKYEGLSSSEASRIRQFERYLGDCIEELRVIKTYRTPRALHAFGRVFTLILPPFYGPSYAQLAIDTNSLTMGILMAIFVPLCLSALFESLVKLEDPFTGYITLDGIDCVEELQVLQWQQLINARKIIYPYAPLFPPGPSPPVQWEHVTEETSPKDDPENRRKHLNSMYQVSINDIEAGYGSEDRAIDVRKSHYRLKGCVSNMHIDAPSRSRKSLFSVNE